jgi:DNA-binding PadR family transcriptional regulator
MKNRVNSRLSPEYVLLGFLYRLPCHGYELHQRLLEVFGNIWHASQSQTYNILKRLEAQGFITSTIIEQEKLPPRQLLQITESGSERFITWLNNPTKSSVHAIRVEFVTRLYFMHQYYPQKTHEMIRVQVEVVNAGLIQLHENLTNIPDGQIFDRLALELRINLLKSVISWLNECLEAFSSEKSIGVEDE